MQRLNVDATVSASPTTPLVLVYDDGPYSVNPSNSLEIASKEGSGYITSVWVRGITLAQSGNARGMLQFNIDSATDGTNVYLERTHGQQVDIDINFPLPIRFNELFTISLLLDDKSVGGSTATIATLAVNVVLDRK